MNCDDIMETMLAYMMNKILGKSAKEPSEAVIRHLAGCPSCKEQIDISMKILTDQNFRLSNPPSCTEVSERIPELVEMDEDLIPDFFPAEWLHLKTCQQCGAVYRMTRSCMTPEIEAAFDRVLKSALPFPKLKQAVWEKIAPHLQELATELYILVSKGKEALKEIPQWLGTAVLVPEPAPAYRGDLEDLAYRDDSEKVAYRQIITIPDERNKRHIVIQTRGDAPECIQLSVGLADVETNSNIDSASVALLDEKGRTLMRLSRVSGSEGFFEFPVLSPGTYKVRISESENNWELPLRLS
jgi:hypothetical protein